MSLAPNITARTAGTRRNAIIVRAIIGAALLGVFALFAFMAIRWFGTVEGSEFSPDTFKQRHFYYLELPLVRLRISAVYHEDISGPLETRVRQQAALFPRSKVSSPRWHLVAMNRGGREFTGDAQVVARYFDAEGDTALRWLKWNREHAELARILWPAIVELCRREHYTFAPEVFATAEHLTTEPGKTTSASEFRTAIGESLARQYVQLANAEQGLEHHEAAVQHYSIALKHDANDLAALRGRALSYAALNQGAKANADRETVKKLQRAAR